MGNLKKLMTKDSDVKIKILMKCPALTQINADIVNLSENRPTQQEIFIIFTNLFFKFNMAKGGRLASLDIFRGLTVAFMIIVNTPGSWKYVYGPLRHSDGTVVLRLT